MANKLIVAAAGSGKTTFLIKEALKIATGKVLITTFTEANEREIRNKFIEINGCIPENVVVQTWFSFLLQHGVKPYQSVLIEENVKGLLLVNHRSGFNYMFKGVPVYFAEKETKNHYFSPSMLIYSDKISKFVYKANEITSGLILERLSRIYSNIFIDEIQDLAGYDLEIVRLLLLSDSNLLMVGDPRQVTYHTHEEAKYDKYSDGKIEQFVKEECKDISVEIDKTSLNVTYRNEKDICNFANSIYPGFGPCESDEKVPTGHDGVFLIKPSDVDEYLLKYRPMQLRDKINVKVNPDYTAINFGESKGQTYDRVLIYPTKPMVSWLLDNSSELVFQSRAKLYVAVTRAKYSVAIVYAGKNEININGIQNFKFSS